MKCIVAHAGAINNESQYGANDGGLDRELRMGGAIWEKGGQWKRPRRGSGKSLVLQALRQPRSRRGHRADHLLGFHL